jgi:hypothetical protein
MNEQNPGRKKDYLQKWVGVLERLETEISAFQNQNVTQADLLTALYIKYSAEESYNTYTDIYFFDPDYQALLKELKFYDFTYNRSEIEAEIITFKGNDLWKAQVKVGGDTWVLHKYDVDPFPSKPHAHNLNSNMKLHLGTGEIFNKFKNIGSIGKKDLEIIRNKFEARGFEMPKKSA